VKLPGGEEGLLISRPKPVIFATLSRVPRLRSIHEITMITFSSILARFGPTFGGVLGILLLSYGFIEPQRPWFTAGAILLGCAIIGARLNGGNEGKMP
jgi:hypothetical protein